MKTIAVDVDDTLNDFSETLRTTTFAHSAAYNITPETFDKYVEMLRSGHDQPNDLLSTEYSYFCYKIHCECYKLATARPDAIEFMQWLRANEWRVVIVTYRDLRRSNELTRKWLHDNEIPFDYLFMTLNKLEFCKAWKIGYLVDDHLVNLVQSNEPGGPQVFYPIMSKHKTGVIYRGKGFENFNELKQWIQN